MFRKKVNYILLFFITLFVVNIAVTYGEETGTGITGFSSDGNSYTIEYVDVPNDFYYKYLNNGKFYFSRNTGSITSSSGSNTGVEKAKFINYNNKNRAIYCAEWIKGIHKNGHYYKYGESTWDPMSRRAIVVGAISHILNPDNKIEKNIYADVGVCINHFLANCKGCSLEGSRNFPNLLTKYKNAITQAEKYYTDNKAGIAATSLAVPKFSSNPTLSESKKNGEYIYKTVSKIEVSNLNTTQYGAPVTYKLNITSNNSNAKVSLDGKSYPANGISNKDITSAISGGKYLFTLYIKGSNIAKSKITIRVEGSNRNVYYTSYLYYSGTYKAGKQRLVYPGEFSITRNTGKSMTVVVPNPKPTPTPTPTPGPTPTPTPTPEPKKYSYSLNINKVDEETGNPVKGASFSLKYNGSTVNLTDDGDGTFTWESGVTTTQYDFSRFELTEITVPRGYISSKTTFDIPTVRKGENCYKENDDEYILVGGDNDSLEYCSAHSWKCTGGATLTGTNDCTSTSEVDPVNTCDAGYTLNESTNMCVEDNPAPVENPDDPDNPIIPEPAQAEPHATCDTENGFTFNDTSGKCVKTTIVESGAKCFNDKNTEVNAKYCNNDSYALFTFDGENLTIDVTNVKNTVEISKRAITGDDEVPGAELKVCTKADYTSNKENCTPIKTVNNKNVKWISGVAPKIWRGIVPGDYAIVETIAPSGYSKISTAVEFKLAADGKVTGKTVAKVTSGEESRDIVVVKDTLNKVTVSKTDMATTKELPGATISICRAVVAGEIDESIPEQSTETDSDATEESKFTSDKYVVNKDTGECIPVLLNDGTRAQWVSTDKPKEIVGLPAGLYYLVEKISPAKYSTAESLLFRMNDDGTVTDKDGKSFKNNKVEMKDAPLKEVKTGMLPIIIISVFGFVSLGALLYVYVIRKKSVKN